MSKAAAKPKPEKTRPLHNVSDGDLADLWGELKPRLKRLADRMDEVQAEFKLRGLTMAKGELFIVVKSTSEYKQLDTHRIRTEMGEAFVEKYSKPGSRTTYVVQPIEQPAR